MNPSSLPRSSHIATPTSRREFLARAGGGFGGLALPPCWPAMRRREPPRLCRANPLAPQRAALRRPRAQRHLLFHGWRAQPHRSLRSQAGADEAGRQAAAVELHPADDGDGHARRTRRCWPRTRKFKQHGQSGLWVSDWYPEIASCADDLAVIRSCWADGQTHVASVCQMNTGSVLAGRPSPGFVGAVRPGQRLRQPAGLRRAARLSQTIRRAAAATGAPASCRPPTRARASRRARRRSSTPRRPTGVTAARQRAKLDFINELNKRYSRMRREDHDHVEARIAAYELAYRMQSSRAGGRRSVARDARDPATVRPRSAGNRDERPQLSAGPAPGRARRALRAAVHAAPAASGTRTAISKAITPSTCRESDKPIAGLLKDLKRRGLLDSTLVVWGGEFGRTPMSESGNGRDHNPFGFTMWMAGGGVKGGITYGATDDIGLYAVENPVHVHDIHATILHLLGLDHKQADVPAQWPRRTADGNERPGDSRHFALTSGRISAEMTMSQSWIPADTTEEVARVQCAIFRRMAEETRLKLAFRMTADLRRRLADGIRQRHPEYSARQVQLAMIRLTLGEELFGIVYPGVDVRG